MKYLLNRDHLFKIYIIFFTKGSNFFVHVLFYLASEYEYLKDLFISGTIKEHCFKKKTAQYSPLLLKKHTKNSLPYTFLQSENSISIIIPHTKSSDRPIERPKNRSSPSKQQGQQPDRFALFSPRLFTCTYPRRLLENIDRRSFMISI